MLQICQQTLIEFKDNSSNTTCTFLLSKFEQDGTKAYCYRSLLGTGKVEHWSAKQISENIVKSWSVKPPGKRDLIHIDGGFKSKGDTGVNEKFYMYYWSWMSVLA